MAMVVDFSGAKIRTFCKIAAALIGKKSVFLQPEQKYITVSGLLIFIILSVVASFVLAKKSPPPQPKPQPYPIGEEPENEFVQEEEIPPSDLRSKAENYPKNSEIFTYETLDANGKPSFAESPKKDAISSAVYSQTTENEKEKSVDLRFDEDEIKKGIIYSIILKRPDF